MNITLVPPGKVIGTLPALMPYLLESESWTQGRATVDDIVRFILNGQMMLWAVHENGHAYGHVVTEIKQYPRCKFLNMQYCAGEPHHMQYIEDVAFETLERFALDAGCVGIEFVGRPGWRKTATKYGYETHSITYQKMLRSNHE
jgi:hypothetical protein